MTITRLAIDNAVLALPSTAISQRALDSLWITSLSGKISSEGGIDDALLGTDGITAAEFPSVISPRGFLFGGDDCLTVEDSDLFTFSNASGDLPFTVAFEVELTSLVLAHGIIGKLTGVSDGEWFIYIVDTGEVVVFLIDSVTGNGIYAVTTTALVTSTSTRIIVSYDGSGSVSGINVYIDGDEDTLITGSTGAYTQMRNGSHSVSIGCGGGFFLDGSLTSLLIYDFEITAAEVALLTEGMTSIYSTLYGRSYIDTKVLQVITNKVIDRRLGLYSDNPPTGWKWDRRYVTDLESKETLPRPGLKSSHLLGLSEEYWQNGPYLGPKGEDLEVVQIEEDFSAGKEKWTPLLNPGAFAIQRDSHYLFSDNSVVETFDASNLDTDSRSYHILSKVPAVGTPISAAIFRRSDDDQILVWRDYIQRSSFTSIPDDDGDQQETRVGDTVDWSLVDINRREFIVLSSDSGDYLQFNRNVIHQITDIDVPTILDDFNDLELLGTSTGEDSQIFRTRHFPLSDDAYLKVYVVNQTLGTWTEYSIVETFTAANQVKVDIDYGTVTFGTSLTGSTPSPGAGYKLYISYRTIPRIEYEESGYPLELHAWEANVNPVGQGLNKGFVVISRAEMDVSSIVLSTSISSYQGDGQTYGPIYAGAGYAPLIATVASKSGLPISNLEVTFHMLTIPKVGSIGGVGYTAQGITDHFGKAYSFYTSPNSANEMGYFITKLTGTNSLTVGSEAQFSDVDDIYTYYVLKDDPWQGKVGADTSIGEVEWSASPPNGRKVILYKWDSNARHPITGLAGAYAPVRPTTITDGSLLTYPDALTTPDPLSTTTTNLGAYWVVSDRYVEIIASVYSPRLRTRIWSNRIFLRIEIPEYMKGSYISDALNTSIPFGFRLNGAGYEVASALGGATFLSINPVAGPYPIIDVISGETWEPYTGFWPYGYYGPTSEGVTHPFAVIGLFCNII